jgi:hypothetical protein
MRHHDVASLDPDGVVLRRGPQGYAIADPDSEAVGAVAGLVPVLHVDQKLVVADGLGPVVLRVGALAAEGSPAIERVVRVAQRQAVEGVAR